MRKPKARCQEQKREAELFTWKWTNLQSGGARLWEGEKRQKVIREVRKKKNETWERSQRGKICNKQKVEGKTVSIFQVHIPFLSYLSYYLSYLYHQNHQGSLTYILIFCSPNWVVLIIRSDINFLYSNEPEYVYLVYFGTFWVFCWFVCVLIAG